MSTHRHRDHTRTLATIVILVLLTVSANHPQRLAVLAQLPIELTDGYIRVKVRIGGSEELDFIFDTGATRTVIDSTTAARLGLVTTQRTRNHGQGPFVEKIVEDVNLTVGRLALPALDLLQRSNDRMTLSLGVNIDGVIGTDLLRDYVIEIDYDSRLLTIYDNENFVYTGEGRRLDIDANAYFSIIDAEMVVGDGEVLAGRFLIDTGAGVSLALNTPFVNDNDLLERIGAKHLAYTLAAQDVEMTSYPGRVRRFDLGDYGFDNMPVLLSQTVAGPLSPRAIAGIIGNRIWRRFNTVFDYSRDRIYLEPNGFFDDVFRVDCSGLSITSTAASAVVVKRVQEGSPAAEAGVLVGDEIASINGRSATGYSLSDIRSMLARDLDTVNLALKRDGKLIELSLRLRRLY